jgi:hypothetical protein
LCLGLDELMDFGDGVGRVLAGDGGVLVRANKLN